jgi:transposase
VKESHDNQDSCMVCAGYRRRMVELVRAGRSPDDLAKEFEPTARSIRNWVAQAERDASHHLDGLTSEERRNLAVA